VMVVVDTMVEGATTMRSLQALVAALLFGSPE